MIFDELCIVSEHMNTLLVVLFVVLHVYVKVKFTGAGLVWRVSKYWGRQSIVLRYQTVLRTSVQCTLHNQSKVCLHFPLNNLSNCFCHVFSLVGYLLYVYQSFVSMLAWAGMINTCKGNLVYVKMRYPLIIQYNVLPSQFSERSYFPVLADFSGLSQTWLNS